ncbi:30S ribosomal protein S13 [Patescibacteria group bacterium]|nr:30S ribosomal protein S13 [Patescibacteria group bacterium]MBU1663069.1 30S ribosomal protein S13 [Patescibacteria group bacterium]MBU1934013.1 30S ribosomal protein S13 [Patescibacteria group bacterium]MBU2007646.1 30S ribosomal protein S13 [Patescibacteria group bacterium]MBU2233513.1 30S ribosomal protein S13 [Patescibacteria group bacterium]
MAIRIAGIIIPNEKRIEIALTYIYGIGKSKSQAILKLAKINPDTRVKNLTDEQSNKLRDLIEKHSKVEGDLKRDIFANIKRLKEINSYRGSRHAKGLPCRGQRTKTNNRTIRGNVRKTATSGKKLSAQKT